MATGPTGPLNRLVRLFWPWGVAVLLVVVVVAFAECWPLSGRQDAADGSPDAPTPSQGISAAAYAVDLTVDDTSFSTTTIITIHAGSGVTAIVINAKQLDVAKKVTVYGTNKDGFSVRVPVTEVVVQEDREEVEIRLEQALAAGGTYNVTVTATGVLGKPSDDGLIKTTFGSQHSWLAAIRTSPSSARMVFPCVDEPGEQADVSLHVWRPATHSAISNAPVTSTEDIGVLTAKDTFATVRLAPHQVGLVVAPLKKTSDSGVTLWGREQADATLDEVLKYVAAVDSLAENLSGLPHASQLSVVALPGVDDAASTAGIVALSEEAVLSLHTASPTSAHRDALLHLAEAVAQPAVRGATRPAHWDDAWTLAGLAAHLRHRLADQAAPGWRMADQQMALQLQDVLEEDAKTMNIPLKPPHDSQLGAASAGKAAALVRMLEYALNPKVFDGAVRRFYSVSASSAVEVDDLYDAFSQEVYEGDSGLSDGVTIVNVMTAWASNPGYPIVTVIRDYENNVMTVSQKKFSWASITCQLQDPGSGADCADSGDSEWWVPLSYTYALEGQNDGEPALYPHDWLVPGENDMEVEFDDMHLSSDDWVYFNLEQAAPYRVNYDTFNWRLLTRELLGVQFDKTLSPASRAHILGDALALARAGELDYAMALNLAAYLHQEYDLLPWLVARRSFAFLEDRLQDEALSWLHQFEALLLKDVYLDDQFGMGGAPEMQSPDVRLLRELAVTWACEAGLQQCLDHADELYSQWSSSGQAPHADMVEAVLCRAVALHGDEALNFLLAALANDAVAPLVGGPLVGGQRGSYVRAAACAASEDLLRRTVSEALNSTGPFMASEVAELLEATSSRKPQGWAVVKEFLEKDFSRIQERTGNQGELERLSLILASKTTSESQLAELLEAVAAAQGSANSTLATTIQSEVFVNLAWAKLNADLVADWIRVFLHLPPPATPTPATGPTTTPTTSAPNTTTAAPGPSPSPTPSGASVLSSGPAMRTIMLLAVAAAGQRLL